MPCGVSFMIVTNLACALVMVCAATAGSAAIGCLAVFLSGESQAFVIIGTVCSAIIAIMAAGALFASTLVVEGLRRLLKARWWVMSLIATPVLSAGAGLVAWLSGAGPAIWLSIAAGAFLLFGVYWHLYLGATALLSRLIDRLAANRVCAAPH